MKAITLNNAHLGKSVIVDSIDSCERNKNRLMELGIIKGSTIKPIFRAPFWGPTAYEVKNTIVAIRKSHAKNINVISDSR